MLTACGFQNSSGNSICHGLWPNFIMLTDYHKREAKEAFSEESLDNLDL